MFRWRTTTEPRIRHRRSFGYDEFFEFLKSRRSVRVFKDKPVERDVITKILNAAATAPMGIPPSTTETVYSLKQTG